MPSMQLSARFWDHLSDKHSTSLSASETIDMARADVEIELAKCASILFWHAKRDLVHVWDQHWYHLSPGVQDKA